MIQPKAFVNFEDLIICDYGFALIIKGYPIPADINLMGFQRIRNSLKACLPTQNGIPSHIAAKQNNVLWWMLMKAFCTEKKQNQTKKKIFYYGLYTILFLAFIMAFLPSCAKMSLQEARHVAVSMNDPAYIPPPRKIDDITIDAHNVLTRDTIDQRLTDKCRV